MIEGLECSVGGERFVVPSAAIRQLLDIEVARQIPLVNPLISGLTVYDGAVVVTVRLGESNGAAAGKVILLNTPASPYRWALEVSDIASFVRLTPTNASGSRARPWWLKPGTASSGETVDVLDVAGLVRALEGNAT